MALIKKQYKRQRKSRKQQKRLKKRKQQKRKTKKRGKYVRKGGSVADAEDEEDAVYEYELYKEIEQNPDTDTFNRIYNTLDKRNSISHDDIQSEKIYLIKFRIRPRATLPQYMVSVRYIGLGKFSTEDLDGVWVKGFKNTQTILFGNRPATYSKPLRILTNASIYYGISYRSSDLEIYNIS